MKFKKYWKHPPRTFEIVITVIKGFIADNCIDKASTLTFYSLLTLVPLLAIGFGIAQWVGIGDVFTKQVKTQFLNQPEVADKIIQFAQATFQQTSGGIIASLGLVMLFWTVLRMIGNVGCRTYLCHPKHEKAQKFKGNMKKRGASAPLLVRETCLIPFKIKL